MLKHIQHIAKIILLLNSIWEDFIYEKLITLSTLTAGIGVSAFGLNIHHAERINSKSSYSTSEPTKTT